MRFSRLHLANWRNFAHVDVALEERMFLIGANASGKSNLLDAFRFLRDIVRIGGGFEKAVLDRGGVPSLCSFFAYDNPDIVIDVHIVNGKQEVWRYFLAITQDTQHRPLLQAEKVWRSGTLLLDRPNAQDAIDDRLLRQTHLEQINSNREFREIADFSDGTLRLIGLLWALLDGTGPLLLEKPELSLHQEISSPNSKHHVVSSKRTCQTSASQYTQL